METSTTQPPVFTSPSATQPLPEEVNIVLIPKATKGEEKVHKFAHSTINFWLNYAISLVITDLFLGHKEQKPNQVTSLIAEKSGSKGLQNVSDWLRDKTDQGRNGIKTSLMSSMNMSERVSDSVANTAMDIFTLMMGGHITSIFATHIVNHADKWAKKFDEADDKKHGYTPGPEELAAREARYEYLRNQPKKTAWTVIKGRVLGFLINTFAIGWVSSKLDLRGYYSTPEEMKGKRTGIRSFTQAMGNTAEQFADKKLGWSAKNQARANYWVELIPFEGLCTFNNAFALEWVIGKPKNKKEPLPSWPASASATGTPSRHDTVSTTQAATVQNDVSATPAKEWSEGKVPPRAEVKPREEMQPHEIRNQAAGAQTAVLA